jgi:S1/P1 Nuclease
MKRTLTLILALFGCAPGFGWNNTGHMVVARLAWEKLGEDQRSQAIDALRKHPHYDEFLSADRPEGYSEEEWVFLRAGTWPDWVRNHHKAQFHHGSWHFINYPFVPPGSDVDPGDHQPSANEENIVKQLQVSVNKIKHGDEEEKAIYLCWLLHLAGDIHQPLHCTALFSEQFPDGDRGGNLAFIRTKSTSKKSKLHPLWDGLLGKSTSPATIGKVVNQARNVLEDEPQLVADDLAKHKTFDSWAKESFDVAKKAAYLDGKLKVGEEEDEDGDVSVLPSNYAKNAGQTARIQVAKAGQRLADTLSELLK